MLKTKTKNKQKKKKKKKKKKNNKKYLKNYIFKFFIKNRIRLLITISLFTTIPLNGNYAYVHNQIDSGHWRDVPRSLL